MWSTTVRVVTRDPGMLRVASQAVESELVGMDRAASRFRVDSEVCRLAASGGRPTRVSPLLAATLRAALRVASATGGAVDPTVGNALVAAGYDADFSVISARAPSSYDPRPALGPQPALDPQPALSLPIELQVATTWRDIHLVGDVVTLPDGLLLDLGATGKALAVDRAAVRASIAAQGPVLVAVGGDLRAAGTSRSEPWLVEVAERPEDEGVAWVRVSDGGVATSTTLTRRWRAGAGWAHHVFNPRTGRPAEVHWRTATVAAATCVDANAASTASIVKGLGAEAWLRSGRLPSRLVDRDGAVLVVAGWPEQVAA